MLLRQLLRGLIIQRLLYGRRRHRHGWGRPPARYWGAPARRYGMGRGYRGAPVLFGRPRGRTQVRVGGCCLPIPLGLTALTAAAVRAGQGRR